MEDKRKGDLLYQATYEGRDLVSCVRHCIHWWTYVNVFTSSAEIVCWVSENMRPFEVVNDHSFQSLMMTGRPVYHLPHARTVARNVTLVFARTKERIAEMLQVRLYKAHEKRSQHYQNYNGKLNFATDAWMAPNHRAFITVTMHLEQQGVPLALPLDIIEVSRVCRENT